MELFADVVAVLTPLELKNLKRSVGMTLAQLSERTGISSAQLSEFSNGRNGLRRDQVERCVEVLLAAAKAKSQTLAKLLEDAG